MVHAEAQLSKRMWRRILQIATPTSLTVVPSCEVGWRDYVPGAWVRNPAKTLIT
jgi:hypothetical protein